MCLRAERGDLKTSEVRGSGRVAVGKEEAQLCTPKEGGWVGVITGKSVHLVKSHHTDNELIYKYLESNDNETLIQNLVVTLKADRSIQVVIIQI